LAPARKPLSGRFAAAATEQTPATATGRAAAASRRLLALSVCPPLLARYNRPIRRLPSLPRSVPGLSFSLGCVAASSNLADRSLDPVSDGMELLALSVCLEIKFCPTKTVYLDDSKLHLIKVLSNTKK